MANSPSMPLQPLHLSSIFYIKIGIRVTGVKFVLAFSTFTRILEEDGLTSKSLVNTFYLIFHSITECIQ